MMVRGIGVDGGWPDAVATVVGACTSEWRGPWADCVCSTAIRCPEGPGSRAGICCNSEREGATLARSRRRRLRVRKSPSADPQNRRTYLLCRALLPPCIPVLSCLCPGYDPWASASVLVSPNEPSGSQSAVDPRFVLLKAVPQGQGAGCDDFRPWSWLFRVKEGQGFGLRIFLVLCVATHSSPTDFELCLTHPPFIAHASKPKPP